MAVLLLAEIAGGALALDATAKAVTAAKSLGDVTVLVAGPAAAGQAASQIDGVAKVVVADDAAYANGLAEQAIMNISLLPPRQARKTSCRALRRCWM